MEKIVGWMKRMGVEYQRLMPEYYVDLTDRQAFEEMCSRPPDIAFEARQLCLYTHQDCLMWDL